jgi:hypothetical protein
MEKQIQEYNIETACPVCFLDIGNTALSRVDNKTKICKFCAMAEAKDTIAVKTTREEMKFKGHSNYKCYLEEARHSSQA